MTDVDHVLLVASNTLFLVSVSPPSVVLGSRREKNEPEALAAVAVHCS